jgi:hypothetical protein
MFDLFLTFPFAKIFIHSGALCTTSESPRRRISRNRQSPTIFSYDGALIKRVLMESLFFGGDRRGSRGPAGPQTHRRTSERVLVLTS